MERERRGIDLYLLGWIKNTNGLPNVPYDLKKIKRLENRQSNWPFDPYLENLPSWLEPEQGNYFLIGDMTNLQSLSFHQVALPDFSFLSSCKRLRKLDVSKTNFTDCGLLLHLPALNYVYLPARKRLHNTEALDQISAKVTTNEPFYNEEDFPPFQAIPNGALCREMPVRCVCCVEVHYYSASNGERRPDLIYNVGDGVSRILDIKTLMQDIQSGRVKSVFLSLDPFGEDEFLTVDIKNGWAALMYSDIDNQIFYQSYNSKYTSAEELAPPEIGGQTPVPKPLALDDLELTAKCVGYFFASGQLYPESGWVRV